MIVQKLGYKNDKSYDKRQEDMFSAMVTKEQTFIINKSASNEFSRRYALKPKEIYHMRQISK